ncbi:MAG: sialate O-acetylesterase, partial [Lentisphaerota bacterium]
LSHMFSDHMVLQRDAPVPVWGTGAPGEEVTVEFANQKKSVAADADGNWMVKLDPLKVSSEPQTMTLSSSKIAQTTRSPNLQIKNILVGEVWFASGQSNMEMPVGDKIRPDVYPGVENFAEEVKNANHPKLRLLKIDRQMAVKPLADAPTAGWKVCTPESAEVFSATAYFFGRHLIRNLDMPVGIIVSACSSSSVEQWISLEALEAFPQFAPVVNFYRNPATAKLDNQEYRQRAPKGQPSCLFNGGVAPVIPYAIRGVIWYQGESNASRAVEYRQLLPNMISDWRRRWGQGDFPFIQVQLAGFHGIPKNPGDDTWAELREAQAFTADKIANVHLSTAIDIGMSNFIHPKNKQEVGRRLGLVAMAMVYDAKIAYNGPVLKKMEIMGANVVLTFDQFGGDLVSRNQVKPGSVSGFAIAGADHVWHWADAAIRGDTIVVSCPQIQNPVAVRYAWSSNIACDFYNQAGLPAFPFRTDDWPLMTDGKIYTQSN